MSRNHYLKFLVIFLIFTTIISLSIICEPNCSEMYENTITENDNIELSNNKYGKQIADFTHLLSGNYEISSLNSAINKMVFNQQSIKKDFSEKQLFAQLTDSMYLYLNSQSDFDIFFTHAYNSLKLKYIEINLIENQIDFNNALKDSWYSYLTRKLKNIDFHRLNTCQRDKYLYLKFELEYNGYYLKQQQSNFEKVIYNIKKSNWSHLISSIYYKLTFIEKVLLSLFFTLTIYLYLQALVVLLKKIFKNES